jgi:hypothetical protein
VQCLCRRYLRAVGSSVEHLLRLNIFFIVANGHSLIVGYEHCLELVQEHGPVTSGARQGSEWNLIGDPKLVPSLGRMVTSLLSRAD